MWRTLKEEAPEVILICPPCTAFTGLQEWNFRRLSLKRAMAILFSGLHHLDLAAEVMKWQVRRGKYILFEHPAWAKSWEEESLQEVEKFPGVDTMLSDMCQFEMNVDGAGLNKKTTKWMSNMPEVLNILGKRCRKDHFHVPLLHGLAKKAQEYPARLCSAIAEGIRRHLQRVHAGEEAFMEVYAEGAGEAEEPDELLDDLQEALPGELAGQEPIF